MSCLDITTCPTDQIFNRITCNFTLAHVKYICNSTTTCKRVDGLYDCCTSNIAYCTIELLAFRTSPTITPTISSYINSECENTCKLTPSTNKCYWYESQKLDISCVGKDNKYCCSHSRNECCQANMLYNYMAYGIVLFTIIICIIYNKSIVRRYTQVTPEKTHPNMLC